MWESLLESIEITKQNVSFAEEVVLGSIAGFVMCVFGHPFDTLKTRMQVTEQSILQVVRSGFAKDGVLSFYKGIVYPLASNPALNAVIFSSYEISKTYLSLHSDFSKYTIVGLAGGFAGFVSSFIACPTELLKTKKQTQGKELFYKSYPDMIKKLYRVSGTRGIFQGYYVTFFREIIGYGAQFLGYEVSLDYFSKIDENGDRHSSISTYLLAGSVAGICCWTSSFPLDVLKSRVQGQIITEKIPIIPNGRALTEARYLYTTYGPVGFWIGIAPILGRAVIANAFGFLAWEFARKHLYSGRAK